MNKNLMPHEIKLSDWEETYKSPIDMIVQQISIEFDQMAENQLILRVNQAVDFNVDKAELLKALQYDRNQYETGYLDAKKKYQRPKGEWIMHIDDFFPEDSMQECSNCHEHQYLTCDDNFCPNCGADMRGEE